jgi:hypothetical protein
MIRVLRSEILFRLGMGLLGAGIVFGLAGCFSRSASAPKKPNATLPQDTSNALFVNVSEEAGIRFQHSNGASTGKFLFIESTPAGCGFIDYDNDGFLDIVLVQSGSSEPPEKVAQRPFCALYHNNGDGTFTEVTQGSGFDRNLGYGHGVAIGDYDNDGYDDIFLTSYPRNYLFHNEKGTGKFRDVSEEMGLGKTHSTGYATSAAFGDYDNDGKLDLYVAYYCPWTYDRDKPCRDAEKQRDYCSPQIYEPETHRLYHNEGTRFRDVSDRAGISKKTGRGLAVAFYDYDEDGRQDIFVANDLTENFLWRNEGNGKFVQKADEAGVAHATGGASMASMGIAIADFDRSGRESLFVTNFSGQPNMLYKNLGNGLFEDRSMPSGVALPHMKFLSFGCEFFDYDADSWPDLVTANGHVQTRAAQQFEGVTYRERKQLFRNQGNGTFQEITDPALLGALMKETVARGLAIGDYNNDGRLDLLFNSQNEEAELMRNQTQHNHHWVSFKAVGVKSNRNGYHARFTLTAGGVKRIATVRAGSSYLSASDPRVYFGLGNIDKIERVEIQWPGGTRDVLTNVEIDASHVVTEGKGITRKLPRARPNG